MNIVGARFPTDNLRRSTFTTGQMASVFELRSQELFDSPFPRQGVIRHVEGDGQFHVIRKIHQLSHPFKQSSPNAGPCRKFNFAALGARLCQSPVQSLPMGPYPGFVALGHGLPFSTQHVFCHVLLAYRLHFSALLVAISTKNSLDSSD